MQAVFVLVAGAGAFIMYWAYKGHSISDLKTGTKGLIAPQPTTNTDTNTLDSPPAATLA